MSDCTRSIVVGGRCRARARLREAAASTACIGSNDGPVAGRGDAGFRFPNRSPERRV